ncbi:MAG: dTMP kinase [Bacteroidota bacterium]
MGFIVLEGLDGSGKSTQVSMLKSRLENRGIAYEYLHFPRLNEGIFGEMIARFLRGEMGEIGQVDPYLVALIYAGDRADAAEMIRNWISAGKLVLVDRYVYSNIAFQGAKTAGPDERRRLRDWILHLEYSYYHLPKPDLNIFLDVPFSFTRSRLGEAREGDDRSYLNGKGDIHEQDLSFQEKVREVYLEIGADYEDMLIVNCTATDGGMLPPEKVAEKIAGSLRRIEMLKDL